MVVNTMTATLRPRYGKTDGVYFLPISTISWIATRC
jgi:hypothetical protein